MSRFGLDLVGGAVRNNVDAGVLEPVLAKIKIIQARAPAAPGRAAGWGAAGAGVSGCAGRAVGGLRSCPCLSAGAYDASLSPASGGWWYSVRCGSHKGAICCRPASLSERTVGVCALQ
jgi:hypothetical protein